MPPTITVDDHALGEAAQINQLSGAGCEMVFLTSLPTEASPILETAAGLGFNPQWIGQSPRWVGVRPDFSSDAAQAYEFQGG